MSKVRALIDSCSQRSYILNRTAPGLYSKASREDHACTVWGASTSEQHHHCNDAEVGEGSYFCPFKALDETMIFNGISAVPDGPWIDELKTLNIGLSDTADDHPIELLIGADVAGKLYTGRRQTKQFMTEASMLINEARFGLRG